MTTPVKSLEDLTLNVTKEIQVNAPMEATFEALIEEMGSGFETPEGKSMSMKIEAWPGGRWYRDLGDNNGHFWANVQAIKKPSLLEVVGPLFASYPFISNLQYRLTEANGGTLITFRHTAFGMIDEQHRQGVAKGWGHHLERVRKQAEAMGGKKAAGGRGQ